PAMSEHPPSQEAHWPEGAIFTLGHSTLPIERFVAVLQAYGIERLADIRTIPRSRHNPQFNDTTLANSLKAQHLDYVHLRALGGLRHARKVSPMPAGATKAFAASPIICKQRISSARSKPSFAWAKRNASRSCAPKRCRGAAIARWWPTRSACAAFRSSRFYQRAITGCTC